MSSFFGGNINIRILLPKEEGKSGQNNPQNRRTLSYARGLLTGWGNLKERRWIFLQTMLGVWGCLFGNENQPLPIGNFSVPLITQIAPLVGFGQLLIGEKGILSQFSGFYAKGHNSYENTLIPNITYGLRDDLDVSVFVPFTPRSKSVSGHSSGIMDILLQAEYAYYTKSDIDYAMTGSIVGNVQFPTGSDSKDPRTGNGSSTYFLGTTFSYLSYNWYAFISPGAFVTTAHHGKKIGNSYLYQWGFARYIPQWSPKGWIFDLMIEFDGTYAEKDKIRGVTNPDSGGNIIFVTPSLWLSSKRLIFQWGVGFPIVQDLHGDQDKIHYFIAYNVAVAFQF